MFEKTIDLFTFVSIMIEFKKVAFYTLGCKLNFSETSTLSRMFEKKGFAKVAFDDCPDVYVINTCSVTENADKKCKQLVKKAKKINPNSFVVIVGCYAQLKPIEISQIPGVNLVLGANEKFDIIEHLESINQLENKPAIFHNNIKHVHDFQPSHSIGDRTRSFFKIQDGCDYFCTFCTIPLARGKSRNSSIAKTVQEAKNIALTQVKEVVLTGVNIGDFGQGSEENFFKLIQELDNIEGIKRFRISSIEPNLLSNEIIDFCLLNSKRFVPHFHIPLQSGSDSILRKMRRKYDTNLFKERIDRIFSINPMTCIGIDVIVGFPGETEENFQETLDFLTELEFSYLHVFTYSERANTGAPKLGEKVPLHVRKQRSNILHLLSDRKKTSFYQKNLDSAYLVLFENEESDGFMHGFTDNYIKVQIPYDRVLCNEIVPVKLKERNRDGTVKGEVIKLFEEV